MQKIPRTSTIRTKSRLRCIFTFRCETYNTQSTQQYRMYGDECYRFSNTPQNNTNTHTKQQTKLFSYSFIIRPVNGPNKLFNVSPCFASMYIIEMYYELRGLSNGTRGLFVLCTQSHHFHYYVVVVVVVVVAIGCCCYYCYYYWSHSSNR